MLYIYPCKYHLQHSSYLCVALYVQLVLLFLCLKDCNISCSAGVLPMKISPAFCVWKCHYSHFLFKDISLCICLLELYFKRYSFKDRYRGQFFFQYFQKYGCFTCIVSDKKSAVILIFFFYVMSFSMATFKMSSLSLFLSSSIMMCLHVIFFMLFVLGVCQALGSVGL